MYSLNQLREFKKALNSESLPYEETTDQGKKIIIYITKKDNKEYLIKFKFMECLNPNYGHSYYLETIKNHQKNCGLCINGDSYKYERLDYEKINNDVMVCVNIDKYISTAWRRSSAITMSMGK